MSQSDSVNGLALMRWDAPGPYEVAFSTRRGGVSDGAFASLNLGLRTEDEPANVAENRRRLFEALGADPGHATGAWQQHGGAVRRAERRGVLAPGAVYEACDGLWSDEPGRALLLVTADCLPIALARRSGTRRAPALAVLHAGWKGLLAGIVEAGVAALGGGRLAAVIGPGIGPCCYEVGEVLAERYRAAFGADVLRRGHLDLRAAAERALRAAGCGEVERIDVCTACHPELFFSHRRDRGRTGRQGVLACVA